MEACLHFSSSRSLNSVPAMTDRFLRLAGFFGVLTPMFTLTLIFVSVALSPWFNWHYNDLSDMGISSTANLFNATLLTGSAFYWVFAIGFVRWRGIASRLAKASTFFLLAGAVGLTLIGIFPEDVGRIHRTVAVTYFLATPLAHVWFGVDWLKRGEPVSGTLSIVAGLAALLMILFVPHDHYAVPEILAALTIGAWTLTCGVKMLFEPKTTLRG